MSCSVCHREKPVVARGLCNACYQRWQKRGTTDYAPQRVRGVCSVNGCGMPHRSRGFCRLHYERLLSSGDPDQTKRPDDWGAKTKHPLYHRWAHMMRYASTHPIVPEWRDFLTFAADIGEPPDAKAKLFVADDSKPLGPQNMVWKHSITERVEGEDDSTYKARRSRVYRRIHKEQMSGYDLKRHYGMSPAAKEEMLNQQERKCAICRCDESMSIKGRRVGLAVDHCHGSGNVRGLLCYQCNTGLGAFKDDPGLLWAAMQYLISA
jgi:hypothetical protein